MQCTGGGTCRDDGDAAQKPQQVQSAQRQEVSDDLPNGGIILKLLAGADGDRRPSLCFLL